MDILGLSTSPSSGGAYALILSERSGEIRLPIIIGSYEAQAIALELENIKPPRPMTHDLLKNVILSFDTEITHILINQLSEGTFYAQIHLRKDGTEIALDARPSDAIAVAVRFKSKIYVTKEVLQKAGITTDPEQSSSKLEIKYGEASTKNEGLSKLEELSQQLSAAIENEEYEKAAKIRDTIQKLKSN